MMLISKPKRPSRSGIMPWVLYYTATLQYYTILLEVARTSLCIWLVCACEVVRARFSSFVFFSFPVLRFPGLLDITGFYSLAIWKYPLRLRV
jgi:hypothetical protein